MAQLFARLCCKRAAEWDIVSDDISHLHSRDNFRTIFLFIYLFVPDLWTVAGTWKYNKYFPRSRSVAKYLRRYFENADRTQAAQSSENRFHRNARFRRC